MDVTRNTLRCRYKTGNAVSTQNHNKSAGYTLIELLTTLAVLLLVFGLGIPSLNMILNINRIASHVNAVAGDMALTRSEAVKRGQHVIICQSDNQTSCSKRTHWEQGWIIYVDSNQNRRRDPEEALLRAQQAFSNGMSVSFNGAFGIDGYIRYKPDGAAFPNGSFTICQPDHPKSAKALILLRTGRLRLSKRNSKGQPISCPG